MREALDKTANWLYAELSSPEDLELLKRFEEIDRQDEDLNNQVADIQVHYADLDMVLEQAQRASGQGRQ